MAVLLALCSATTFGVGDFFGGMASKRVPTTAVLLWSHLIGVVLLLMATLVVSGDPTLHDVGLGAVGGVVGAVGVTLLYQALAIGPMSAVAPITALLAAAVPVGFGFAQGERPEVTVLIGMVAAAAAIVLVSAEAGGGFRPSDLRGVAFALGAGLCFGVFFVILSYTSEHSGVWPLVGSRVTSAALVGALALGHQVEGAFPAAGARLLTFGAGSLDVLANVLYLLAIREGLLSSVSVLSSLYPVSTVLLARVVLGERYSGLQRVGIAIALPAAVLMAV